MPMPIAAFGNGIQKMDMAPITYRDSALGSATEFMEMIFVEVCPKLHLVNMVVQPGRYNLTAHNRKSMVVWVCRSLGNLNTAKDFMNMGLLHGAASPTFAATCLCKVHRIPSFPGDLKKQAFTCFALSYEMEAK